MAEQDLNKLLSKFNTLDSNSLSTRDYILSLDQAKSGVKNILKKQKKDIANSEENIKKQKKKEALEKSLFKSGVDRLKKRKKETINKLQNLQDEFGIQTKTLSNKKPKESLSFKSGLSDTTDKGDKDYKFDDEFLVSVTGELNHDALLDILIDSWDFWKKKNNIDEKTLKELEKDKDKDSSSNSLLKALLYGFIGKGLWKLLGGFKGFMRKIKNLPKTLMNAFKKGMKSLFSAFDKYIWKPIKNIFIDLFNKVKDFIGKGIKKISNFLDDSLKAGRSLFNKAAGLVRKGLSSATKGLGRIKNSISNGIKKLGKNLAKSFSKATAWINNITKSGASKLKNWWNKLTKNDKKLKQPSITKSKKPAKSVKKSVKPKKPPKITSVKPEKAKSLNKTLEKKASKNTKSVKKAVKPNPKEASKIKNIAKTLTKQKSSILKTVGKGFGKVGKFLIRKFPPLDMIFEGAFMAHDVNELAKEQGLSTENAIMQYYQNRRDNFTWVDAALNLLNPVSAGIDAALQLGIDKMAANATDKALDALGFDTESVQERSKKKLEGTSSTMDKIHSWIETAATYGIDSANEEWQSGPKKVTPLTEEQIAELRGDKVIQKDLENLRQTPIPQQQTMVETRVQYVPVNMTSFPEDSDNIPYNAGNQIYFANGM